MVRWLYRSATLLLLLGLSALNVASLTFDVVNRTLSGLIDVLTPSVRATVVADRDAELKRTSADLDRTRMELDRSRADADLLRSPNADPDAEVKRTRAELDASRKTEKAAREAAEEAARKLSRLAARVAHQAGRIAGRMGINAAATSLQWLPRPCPSSALPPSSA